MHGRRGGGGGQRSVVGGEQLLVTWPLSLPKTLLTYILTLLQDQVPCYVTALVLDWYTYWPLLLAPDALHGFFAFTRTLLWPGPPPCPLTGTCAGSPSWPLMPYSVSSCLRVPSWPRPPPWSGPDLLEVLSRHWQSVFEKRVGRAAGGELRGALDAMVKDFGWAVAHLFLRDGDALIVYYSVRRPVVHGFECAGGEVCSRTSQGTAVA